ncbi:MAG: MlaD family protein [Bdellovibrionota bacterium]
MKKNRMELDLKVGLFVTAGVAFAALSLVLLSDSNTFQRTNRYSSHFKVVDGLIPGSKVTLNGLRVGSVEKVDYNVETQDIRAVYTLPTRYASWIREDSTAEISTQGLLGDKFIAIKAGDPNLPAIPSNGVITTGVPTDLGQFISKSDQLMTSLSSIAGSFDRLLKTLESQNRADRLFQGLSESATNLAAVSAQIKSDLTSSEFKGTLKNMSSAAKHLQGVLDKIDSGNGTVGALINDPGLYDDFRALMGGANRNRVIRNLVRDTIRGNPTSDVNPTVTKQK